MGCELLYKDLKDYLQNRCPYGPIQ